MPHTVGKFWPFDSYRRCQRKAIEAIASAFASGKDVVIVEAPTGAGKSPIAVCIARWMIENYEYCSLGERAAGMEQDGDAQRGAYCLTTQKLLQRQYLRDFSAHDHYPLVDMRGRDNFQCEFDESGATCAKGICHTWKDTGRPMILQDGEHAPEGVEERVSSSGRRYCMVDFHLNSSCRYRIAKARTLSNLLIIHNFAYFLTETNYVGEFKPRDLLVIDEAHSVEKGLMSFVEVALSEMVLEKLDIALPTEFDADTPVADVYAWAKLALSSHMKPRLREMRGRMTVVSERLRNDPYDERALADRDLLRPDLLALDSLVNKLETLLGSIDPDNCVLEVEFVRLRKGRTTKVFRRILFKPIEIAPFAEQTLFRNGKKILMLSATILDPDTFSESLGIDKSRMKFIRIPSTFSPENRRVIFRPQGNMSRKSIDATLPSMVHAIKDILKTHSGERGLIHVHTYRIGEHLAKHISNARLMFHNSANREEVLSDFLSDSSDDRVLVSPSMTDGVSLDNDLARFQIICKVPFGYLGDPQVSAKRQRRPSWYELETAKTLMQSFGRAVRNHDDHAVTYVLDGDFDRFYKRTKDRMFPKYVQEAIVYEGAE